MLSSTASEAMGSDKQANSYTYKYDNSMQIAMITNTFLKPTTCIFTCKWFFDIYCENTRAALLD